jgi:RNA polymerase sigma-70 factor, ECF subfamily
MLALERLSPLERAAFLLHDVFDVAFDEVAARLGRSEAAVRQLAARARQHLRDGQPRQTVQPPQAERLLQAFGAALARGDVDALAATLSDDVRFLSDGGGVVAAVPRPLQGAALVAKTLTGFARLADWTRMTLEPATVNGLTGAVLYDADGTAIQTIALEPAADGRIAAIYVTRNPHKLAHLHRR